jgi:hypothetical protein
LILPISKDGSPFKRYNSTFAIYDSLFSFQRADRRKEHSLVGNCLNFLIFQAF